MAITLVEEYSRLLESSRGHVLVQYSGVTVKDLQNLRAKLRTIRPDLDPIVTHRGTGYALNEQLE